MNIYQSKDRYFFALEALEIQFYKQFLKAVGFDAEKVVETMDGDQQISLIREKIGSMHSSDLIKLVTLRFLG